MKTNTVKHIFFDLDHTLWDFDLNSALTFDKIFKMNAVDIVVDEFLDIYEPINLKYWKLYRHDDIDEKTLRYGRLRDALSALNYEYTDALIHQLSQDYIANLSSFNNLFDGALELLTYLQPQYHLHIITNGFQEAQKRKMESSKITHFFKTITNAENSGAKKPNPVIFIHALQQANAVAAESLMIGDSLEADVIGALDMGYDAIFFNYRNDTVPHNIKQIRHLSELKLFL